ncbi:hypothetical protein F5884DRAFT_898042 [Xylogone sp. PMI_703]|nr:hypothetical protein F5884DRAFT_898042 [Xylogone sp. PMI_703]
MSRVRGFLPLFLATAIGVVNGVVVFGPAFKEQQQEKLALSDPSNENHKSKDEILRRVDTALPAQTEEIPRKDTANSWIPRIGLWAGPSSDSNPEDPNSTTRK